MHFYTLCEWCGTPIDVDDYAIPEEDRAMTIRIEPFPGETTTPSECYRLCNRCGKKLIKYIERKCRK